MGKYALIQFCPEPERQEYLNVGLLMMVSDAAGYARVEFVEDPSRIEKLFGNIPDRYFSAVLESLKFRIDKAIRFDGVVDFDEFIERRANEVRVTRLMSLRIDGDPDVEFDRLFEKLVGSSKKRAPRERARTQLKKLFYHSHVDHLLDRPEPIELGGFGITVSAPYAYQNGHYNLIDSIRISENVSESLREAGKKAMEGDLLWESYSLFKARLVVVADFSEQSTQFYQAVSEHFRRSHVKLYRFDQANDLISDIEEHSHVRHAG